MMLQLTYEFISQCPEQLIGLWYKKPHVKDRLGSVHTINYSNITGTTANIYGSIIGLPATIELIMTAFWSHLNELDWGPFYQHGLTSIPEWTSNYIHYKTWDKITFSFPNIPATEVWEWISNFIPHFIGHGNTYQCWDLSYSMLVKEVLLDK